MDYSNFVKVYYNILIRKLNECDMYNGPVANIIPEANPLRDIDLDQFTVPAKAERNLEVLPWFDIVINAPVEVYEKVLESFGMRYSGLRILFSDKSRLESLYNNSQQAVQEDEQDEFIDLIISLLIDALIEEGVLIKHGDKINQY